MVTKVQTSYTEIFIPTAVGIEELKLYPYLCFLSVIYLSHGKSKLYSINYPTISRASNIMAGEICVCFRRV